MDQVPEDTSSDQPARPPMDYEPTGVEAVDRVLEDVASVMDAPVGDHVAVFERAHDQLRRALDAQPVPGDDPQSS